MSGNEIKTPNCAFWNPHIPNYSIVGLSPIEKCGFGGSWPYIGKPPIAGAPCIIAAISQTYT